MAGISRRRWSASRLALKRTSLALLSSEHLFLRDGQPARSGISRVNQLRFWKKRTAKTTTITSTAISTQFVSVTPPASCFDCGSWRELTADKSPAAGELWSLEKRGGAFPSRWDNAFYAPPACAKLSPCHAGVLQHGYAHAIAQHYRFVRVPCTPQRYRDGSLDGTRILGCDEDVKLVLARAYDVPFVIWCSH